MQGRPHHVSNKEKTSGHAQAKMTQRVCNLYRGKTKKIPDKGLHFRALPHCITQLMHGDRNPFRGLEAVLRPILLP